MKKNILFIYPSMLLGGSTTSLLALMNSLNPDKYNIDLQLFRTEGPLMNMLPEYINILPEARLYKGFKAKFCKIVRLFFSKYSIKLLYDLFCNNKKGFRSILADFSAQMLSRNNSSKYDYAIGFLEGWSNRYLAFKINAEYKYAWLHSTFANITKYPEGELSWMKEVDRIIFVTDVCRDDFGITLPSMKQKTSVLSNIIDSSIIRRRSESRDLNDKLYQKFVTSNSFKIITVCRLQINTKGLDRIVAAASKLKKKGYDFIWYILGDGEDEKQFMDMIKNAGVTDCVIPIGARMNPYPFIASSDIMCMPSRYEGKPMAITESMILGVPPVVTEYLSAKEQINSNEEGLIVDNNDEAIEDALIFCMNNKTVVREMRERLLKKEFGNSEYIREIESLLFNNN